MPTAEGRDLSVVPRVQHGGAARGRLLRATAAWTTVGGLLAAMLFPTFSEDTRAPTPDSTVIVPIEEPAAPAFAPLPLPRPSATATTQKIEARPEPPRRVDPAAAGEPSTWSARVERGPLTGLGIVVGANGVILTSAAVVDDTSPIRVQLPDGEYLYAEILAEDADQGLALLAVPADTPQVARFATGPNSDPPVTIVGEGAGPDVLLDAQGEVVGLRAQSAGDPTTVSAERAAAFVREAQLTWRALSREAGRPAPRARPTLLGQGVEPAEADGGAVVELAYDVLNPGVELSAILGASVRPAGQSAWIDDPADDAALMLQSGRLAYRRRFQLPTSAPSGWYEVAWSLLSADKSVSYAFASLAEALRVSGSMPPPGAVPVAPQPAVRVAPPAPKPAANPVPAVRRTPTPRPRPTPTPVRRSVAPSTRKP